MESTISLKLLKFSMIFGRFKGIEMKWVGFSLLRLVHDIISTRLLASATLDTVGPSITAWVEREETGTIYMPDKYLVLVLFLVCSSD